MKASIAKGTFYLTTSSILFIIAGYAVSVWLGRTLGPSDFGIYGVVISLMNIVNIIQTSGLPRSLSKFTAEPKANKESLLKSALILQTSSSFVLTAAVFLFSDVIAIALNDPTLSKYIKFSSLIFPFYGIYALYSGYYNGQHKFKKQSMLNGIYSVSKGVSVIVLAYYFHLYGAISGFIVAPIISIFINLKVPNVHVKVYPYKKLVYFSIPLIVFAFFSTLQQSIDLYLIKALIGENSETGYYTANQNIARIPFFALSAFAAILFPSISKSVSENNQEATSKMISRSLRYALILLMPLTVIFSATSNQLVNLLFSAEYNPGAQSLSILLISFAFLTMFSILANILNGAGYPKKSAGISFIGVIISAIFCYILIPKYGLNGAAIATGISGFFVTIIASILVHKLFKTLIPIINFTKISIASIIIYLILINIKSTGILILFWYSIVGFIYIGLLWMLKEINKTDLDLFNSLIKWRHRK